MPGQTKRKKQLSAEFRTRLEAELDRLGFTQIAVATRLGISQGTVSGWFNRGYHPQPRILFSLAEMLGVSPEWLLTGKQPKLNSHSQRVGEQVFSTLPISPPEHGRVATAELYDSMVREIPLISWAQAGQATSYEEIPPDWQEKILIPVADEKALAIKIRGDSMEPRFQEGDIAVVMPSVVARNGDLVIANIKEEGFAFKIINLIGGDPKRIRLTSYNSVYEPMNYSREKFHWIYPVHSVTKLVRR